MNVYVESGDQFYGQGTSDDDIIVANSFDNGGGWFSSRVHAAGNGGDDYFELRFSGLTAAPANDPYNGSSAAHHVFSGNGSDVFNFTGTDQVQGLVVGRIDNFDGLRDEIQIEGVTIDLANLPENIKIVEHPGGHPDHSLLPQQWIHIELDDADIFYGLEGVRFYDGSQFEPHHIHSEDVFYGTIRYVTGESYPLEDPFLYEFLQIEFDTTGEINFDYLREVQYIDQKNFVPLGFSSLGGAIIQDVDLFPFDAFQIVSGTSDGDLIAAGENHDTVEALAGDDRVWGGSGNDTIFGNSGSDTIEGGTGHDEIFGNENDDVLYGGRNDDEIDGGDGDDVISGDLGSDTMTGGAGADVFRLTSQADGVLENDVIVDFSLSEDAFEVVEGTFADLTITQLGADASIAFGEDEVLVLNTDALTLTSYFQALLASDGQIDGANSSDLINISYTDAEGEFVSNGADLIAANGGDDTVYSKPGNDTVYGGSGDDYIDGGWGNDVLVGGAGSDSLKGGAGADRFVFTANIDFLRETDTILGFTLDQDKFEVTGAIFADLSITQSGVDAVIALGDDIIVVNNTLVGDLTSSQFDFV